MQQIKLWVTRLSLSKTMWFAVLLDILGIIQVNSDFLSTVLTPAQFGWGMIVVGVLIKVLRALTSQPLVDK